MPVRYRAFARHYDVHGWSWWAGVFGDRLDQLLAERGAARARILDAGCGTGTLAIRLAARGHRVTGIDLSADMIAVAGGKSGAEGVAFEVRDITALESADLGGPFDWVVCTADVLNHLETLDRWSDAFRGFAAQLRPGGNLLFDLVTLRGLARLDRVSVAEDEESMLAFVVVYEPAARRSTGKVVSFLRDPASGLYERASETIPEWGHPCSEILDRLRRAGFGEPERLWDSGRDPEEEDRLTLLAAKP